jgi:hypothetical protein
MEYRRAKEAAPPGQQALQPASRQRRIKERGQRWTLIAVALGSRTVSVLFTGFRVRQLTPKGELRTWTLSERESMAVQALVQ